jgi:hypothetical protein
MSGKKIMLLIGGILALIAIISFVMFSSKKATPLPGDTNGDGIVDSGDVTDVNASPTTDGRFVVVEDPAQPFATISPRAEEPLPTTTANGGFDDYDKAVAAGLIPDKDGLYHQVVDPNYNPAKDSKYNYALSSGDFLNSYYGDQVSQVVSGNTSFDQQLNDGGGDLVVSQPTTGVILPDASLAGVVKNVSSDNSPTAVRAYYSQLAKVIAPFDLVNTLQDRYLAMINASDPNQLAAYKQQVENVKTAIAAVKTPSQFLGMTQHYYGLYDKYSVLLDEAAFTMTGQSISDEQQEEFDSAYPNLSELLDKINDDLVVMRDLLTHS